MEPKERRNAFPFSPSATMKYPISDPVARISPDPADIREFLDKVVQAVIDAEEKRNREKAITVLYALFEFAQRYRANVKKTTPWEPFAAVLGPLASLTVDKDGRFVVQNAGENPPPYWSTYTDIICTLNSHIRNRTPFLDSHGVQRPLAELSPDEFIEVIGDILSTKVDSLFQIQRLHQK